MRLSLILCCLICSFAWGQNSLPSISDKTKGCKKMEGLFPLYLDEQNGKLWMEIGEWNTEFLYAISLPAGLGSNDIGLDRGLQGGGRIVTFERAGRKVLMQQPNYEYRAVTGTLQEKKAVAQSFASSTLWGFVAEAETDGKLLVDVTDFLLRDAMQVANRLRKMQQGVYSIDKTRSALFLPQLKNFPLNSEMEASLTFVNSDGNTGAFVNNVAPSPEAITLRVHHSLVQLPDNGYQPRLFDPRSSFIPISFFDYSSPVGHPIEKYYVLRHRLQKKVPGSAPSEAVKPIVYYLDNATPEPVRSALLEGAQWWNQAFEAAGYINAFQVKILPDSADPMDIRYNMINWVHRSTRGWSYGATVSDPRTGEIIKGNVTLGSLRVRQDYLIAQGLLSPFGSNLADEGDIMLQMSLDRLRQLAAHEVGHTLGLMHNYAASANHRASVMDYPHPTIQLKNGRLDFTNAYDKKIGDWDKVAISWGYSEWDANTDTAKALDQLLTTASKKGLLFISDRDARAPGGMHSKAHLWDNGENPVAELQEVMKVRKHALTAFGENNIRQGMPMAMLEDVLVPVYLYHRYQVEAVVKLVGGMDYTYALRSDGQQVTQPIPLEMQKTALLALISSLEPSFLALPDTILRLIPPRPAGYEYSKELFKKRTTPGFDMLSPAEVGADLPLALLFNTERLNRLEQYAALGKSIGLDAVLQTLVTATFEASRKTGIQALIQQQTEQILLTYLMAASVNEELSFSARATVKRQLQSLQKWLQAQQKAASLSAALKGHYLLALDRLQKPEAAKPTLLAPVPPGAPIGCEDVLW